MPSAASVEHTAGFDPVAFIDAVRVDPVAAFDTFAPQVPELLAMARCPQPVNHHSEGSVWNHTRLALQMLADLGDRVEEYAGDALRAAGRWPLGLPDPTLTSALAVLLHDVAKPVTREGPEGGWTYYGHDRIGAGMAAQLIETLDLEKAAARRNIQLLRQDVAWLIDNHLFWLNTDVRTVTDAAVARRYVDNGALGDELRILAWADTLGSRGPDGRPHVDLLVAAEVRLHETRERHRRNRDAPPPRPALSGTAVMDVLDIHPGPRVGAVIAWLDAQGLSGDEALAAVRAHREDLRTRPIDDLQPPQNTSA